MLLHKNKTQLVQEVVSNPLDAMDRFNESNPEIIPLVVVPKPRPFWSWRYKVPSGVSAIIYDCGRDSNPEGLADPGLHLCKPFYNHVAYLVTQQSITYNAPVKCAPTKDDVMVDVELTLVFSIGPGPTDVKRFVYNLGVLKFNQLLSAEAEEAMRRLMRQYLLEDVYELRGSHSDHMGYMLQMLNSKFGPFGVHFSKAAITDVVLNSELRQILQGTTEFRTKMKELDKESDHALKNIEYDYSKKVQEKERFYERKQQDISADISVALVTRERDSIQCEAQRKVAITKAEEKKALGILAAEADLRVAEAQAKKENTDLLGKTKSNSQARRIQADENCKISVTESEALIKVTEDSSAALKIQAEAEGAAASSLSAKRSHDLNMAKYEVAESIARRAKLVIGGDSADSLIGTILEDSLLIDIQL